MRAPSGERRTLSTERRRSRSALSRRRACAVAEVDETRITTAGPRMGRARIAPPYLMGLTRREARGIGRAHSGPALQGPLIAIVMPLPRDPLPKMFANIVRPEGLKQA